VEGGVGVNVSASTACSVDALEGYANVVSAGGGWGPDATGDGFIGRNPDGTEGAIGGGLTLGVGAGAGASDMVTRTWVGPSGALW
jgi:hypothetical protein